LWLARVQILPVEAQVNLDYYEAAQTWLPLALTVAAIRTAAPH
jgi:hypothetical protein